MFFFTSGCIVLIIFSVSLSETDLIREKLGRFVTRQLARNLDVSDQWCLWRILRVFAGPAFLMRRSVDVLINHHSHTSFCTTRLKLFVTLHVALLVAFELKTVLTSLDRMIAPIALGGAMRSVELENTVKRGGFAYQVHFWATVCTTAPYDIGPSSCPSLCDVGVLWPNGWMDQDETWHGGVPRSLC